MIFAIYDRRSIRKFIDKPISQKDITNIIQVNTKQQVQVGANMDLKA